MKLTIILLVAFSFSTLGKSLSQEISLSVKNASLEKVMHEVRKQSGYAFIFKAADLKHAQGASITTDLKKASIQQTLQAVFADLPYSYEVKESTIVLRLKEKPSKLKQGMELRTLFQEVTGKVVDSLGRPLVGASIQVKGEKIATIADTKGEFSIKKIDLEKVVLIVSFTGFKTTEVQVNGRNNVTIRLEQAITALDETVVIGYGVTTRKDLTGSIASVSGEAINELPVSSVAEALTGRLPGVNITQSDGAPDAPIKIRIRGGGSITQDNSPLYVVDGFVVGDISNISPSEIQSIDVLKDASATAIYGSRGANGVILVTTKQPIVGQFRMNFNSSVGTKQIANKYNVLSPYHFVLAQYERANLSGGIEGSYEPFYGSFTDINLYKKYRAIDWQDEVFGRNGVSQNYQFSIMGGSKTSSYNIAYNRVDEKAIMVGSDYQRDNVNAKLTSKPLNWLEANLIFRFSDLNTRGSGVNDNEGMKTTATDSRLRSAVVYAPFPIKNILLDDDEEQLVGSLVNPLHQIQDNDRKKNNKSLAINGEIAINPIKGLRISSKFGVDKRFGEDNRFYGTSTYFSQNGAVYKGLPAIELNDRLTETKSMTNTISYDFMKFLNKDHVLSVLVGQENIISNGRTFTNLIEKLPEFFESDKAWAFTGEGTPISSVNFFSPEDKLLSFFGRANYKLLGKYLLTATMRADGSSKFAPGNRWGYFPSTAIAWNISDEKFLLPTKEWLDFLKLRFSYGVSGNNRVPSLAYMQTYSASVTTNISPSLATSYWNPGKRMSNPDLKWETTIARNVGLDFELFKGSLKGILDAYYNSTKDLIIEYPMSGTGYDTQLRNIGETSNKGIEISLTKDIIRTEKLYFAVSINASKNFNKVVDLGGLDAITANSNWTYHTEASNDYKVTVGQPVGQMYGFITDGWYTEEDFSWNGTRWVANAGVIDNSAVTGVSWGPGALRVKDLYDDKIIDEADRTILGNANPKHTGGINLNAAYKGFDFSALFNWVYGNNILNASKIEMTSNYSLHRNVLSDMTPGKYYTRMNYQTGEMITNPVVLNEMNENATIWSPVSGRNITHSWAIEDGSFIRLKNLTIGYSLPDKIIKKIGLQQFRVYATGVNLLLWTTYTGFDPEVDTRRNTPLTPGVDYSAYPKSRTVVGGVQVTF